jgi:F-type H+-transporting ATPase subunit gamma
MRRPSQIEKEAREITTVKDLTGVFESLASTQVAKVKSKVELSKQFFQLLWARYSAIRIDPDSQITGRELGAGDDKKVFIVISAEAGLSGDIDQRLIEAMQQNYDPKTTDIIVLGSHGANQLSQRHIPYVRFFQVPESDSYIDVSPVVDALNPYSQIIVYYEEYVSLGVQNIRSIDLINNVREMSEEAEAGAMHASDTIFEPSLDDIADQMELTMMNLALSQTILESSLAQAASRFNAMAAAEKRASELLGDFTMEYHRAKRSESDRRLREVLISLKKKKRTKAAKKPAGRH